MTTAAVFDLDRTLLAGGSGPVFARALRRVGLGPERDVPGADALFRAYELVGETYPSMMLARRAAAYAKGWPIEEVDAAAEAAAVELLGLVQPYARAAIEEHRAEGRRLVVATTTPRHLVAPFAEALGLEVVATRYGVRDGRYDGTIDGEFVWGRGKLRAVRAWATEHHVDLRRSVAYSDSYYDVPLLAAVGTGVAVNPDPRLLAVARLRGWPVRYFDAPEGVVKALGKVELQQVGMPFAVPELLPFARLRIDGVERLPDEGGAIVAFNHRSYFDSTAMAYLLSRHGRPARFLGKKEVFDAPVVGQLAKAFGGIRVDRGTGSDEPLDKAAEALRAGELVAIAPQGTIPRGPAFFEPELRARWGCARLAAMSGAPVYPVGLWGTEKVWPRNRRLPAVPTWWARPEVTVTVGDPVRGLTGDPDADTRRIMAAIVELLPPEARERREPTEAELAATYPPGYSGDPTAEGDRRPGTDT